MASCFFMLATTLLWLFPLSIPSFAGVTTKGENAQALFVFGDSYADSGNHDPLDSNVNKPWRMPYGFTWPGRPSGRFSNGRVLTDFFAAHLGLETPLPYRQIQKKVMEHGNNRHVRKVSSRGINFAFGGSGVFPTFGPQYPNISTQIDHLRAYLRDGLVSPHLLSTSSVALLVVAGNDYTAYGLLHPKEEGIFHFIRKVVAEIATCVEVLHGLGFQKLVVTNLEPFGCFPGVTYLNNYTSCNETANNQSGFHNKLLASHISKLKAKLPNVDIVTLDLEHAFNVSLQGDFNHSRLQWKSCCESTKKGDCGDVDDKGRPLYKLCSKPQKSFYWDTVHPTDAGWASASKILFSHKLFKN